MRIHRRIVWGLLVLVFLGIAGTIGGFYAAGYRPYIIHTGSMVPELVPGDLVIDRPADGHYRVGDVITFRHGPTDDLVTHRITQITGPGIHTKGDANPTADVWTIPRSFVEGVGTWRIPGAGYAVVFLRQPTGFAAIVMSLVGLILLWQLFFPDEKDETQTKASAQDVTPDEVPALSAQSALAASADPDRGPDAAGGDADRHAEPALLESVAG